MSGQTRIINRLADAQLVSGDYVLVDSQTEGTRKFDLGTFANTTNTAISNIESAIDSTSEAIGDTDISEVGDGTFTGGLTDHEERLDDISEVIGNTSMGTTATTLTGAIAEHESDITSLNNSINNITYFSCTDAGSYYDITRQNCYAIGKRVFISVELVVTSANPPTSADLCIVPAGYRPASALNNKGFVYHLRSSGSDIWSDLRPALLSISTSGAVRQYLSSAFLLNEVVVVWAEYMMA